MAEPNDKYEVIKRSEFAATSIQGFDLGAGRQRKFSRQGVMYLSDPGEAKHIEAKYGPKGSGDVLVSKIKDFHSAARRRDQERINGGRKVFSVPELPWKKKAVDCDPDIK